MRLSPKDIDKLILHGAGVVAQKRYARGLLLNYPESVALIATQLLEFIRDGESVVTLMNKGKNLLGITEVMSGVPEMIHEIQVEGTFPDGTKLVTVHNPICRETGEEKLALYGSGLKRQRLACSPDNSSGNLPGETFLQSEPLALNADRNAITLEVTNLGDRPIQVGSHYPFFETNSFLKFDRAKAYDLRLDIPSGTAIRFESGESKIVSLIPVSGKRKIYGGNALISGALSKANKIQALKKSRVNKFADTKGA